MISIIIIIFELLKLKERHIFEIFHILDIKFINIKLSIFQKVWSLYDVH